MRSIKSIKHADILCTLSVAVIYWPHWPDIYIVLSTIDQLLNTRDFLIVVYVWLFILQKNAVLY